MLRADLILKIADVREVHQLRLVDIDQKGLDKSYNAMAKAYRRIFERCGLETIPVQADSGNMGGSTSEEFMVASEIGEEVLLLCEKCEYRANSEKAEYKRSELLSGG